MRDLKEFITEATNTEHMFMGKTSKRTQEGFSFTKGEKVVMMRYTEHHYVAQVRGVYTIEKVGKNSVSISHQDPEYQKTLDVLKLKFDKYGIAVVKRKSKYFGKETDYWVLYNKELADDKDLQELLDKGNCMWHFSFVYDKEENQKQLKEYIDEINKG